MNPKENDFGKILNFKFLNLVYQTQTELDQNI